MTSVGNVDPNTGASQSKDIPLQAKNTHRLYRIFRKPRSTVALRPWHGGKSVQGEADERIRYVSKQAVMKLISGLTDSEKQRAQANLDPLPLVHEELAKRAARFGVLVEPGLTDSVASGSAMAVDEQTLRRREWRFKSAEKVEMDLAMQRRLERFGGSPSGPPSILPIELKLSEKDKEQLEARARRFAS